MVAKLRSIAKISELDERVAVDFDHDWSCRQAPLIDYDDRSAPNPSRLDSRLGSWALPIAGPRAAAGVRNANGVFGIRLVKLGGRPAVTERDGERVQHRLPTHRPSCTAGPGRVEGKITSFVSKAINGVKGAAQRLKIAAVVSLLATAEAILDSTLKKRA
jgi:hypothetical protein